MKMYHCSSLEQIAAMFQDRANAAKRAAEKGKTQSVRKQCMVEAMAWAEAAGIILNTEIHS